MAAAGIETDPLAVVPVGEPARPLRRIEEERIRPDIADPAPLGLAALAMTTLVLGMVDAGLLTTSGPPVVLTLALVYGGLAQLLAGMWEFRRGSAFGALAFTSLGGLWLSFGVLEEFLLRSLPAAQRPDAIALFMIAWGIFAASLWIASLRTTLAMNATLLLLAATLLLLGIGSAGSSETVIKVGGWFGIATAAVAWYAAFAAVINSTFGRTVLPLVPLRRGL